MEKKIIKLKEKECEEVTLVATGKPYGGKLKGQTYSQFKFDGTVFNVNDNLGFKEAVEKQDLSLVKLIDGTREKVVIDSEGNETTETVRSLELEMFTTETAAFAKEIRHAKHQATLTTIKRVAEAEAISEDALQALRAVNI